MSITKDKTTEKVLNYLILTVGTIIAAAALELFLIPNTILDGGVVGIAIIVYKLTGWPLGLLVIALNIPFVYIGYKALGKGFLIRTLYSMISFAIFLSFLNIYNHLPKKSY